MVPDINTFSERSDEYQRSRPLYPESLFRWISNLCKFHERAWDCATGNGQAALGLASYFEHVDATDISKNQMMHRQENPRITYSTSPAERTPFDENRFDLVTVAQALHWFDFNQFWEEVSRVSKPGTIFCAWGYDWLYGDDQLNNEIIEPFRSALEPFWRPNNRILWEGYRNEDIRCPFPRVQNPPELSICVEWTVNEVIDYMRTWSAYKIGRQDPRAGESINSIVKKIGKRALALRSPQLIEMPLKLFAAYVE